VQYLHPAQNVFYHVSEISPLGEIRVDERKERTKVGEEKKSGGGSISK
jgi:hypothetical protein